MVAENETPALLSFNEWLDAVKRNRENGGNSSSVSKDMLKNYRAQFAATTEAFEAFKTDPAIWLNEEIWGKNNQNMWDGKPAFPERDKSGKFLPIPEGGLTEVALYKKLIMGLTFTAEIVPPPYGSAFMQWALEESKRDGGYIREKLKEYAKLSNDEVEYDLFRADMLEAFGQEMAKHGLAPAFESNQKPDGTFNTRYVTQKADGTWLPLPEDKVVELLRRSVEKKGPHVVITANHAFLESMDDLRLITDGYKKLLTDPLVTKGKTKLVTVESSDQEFAPDETILIAAEYTRENNYLNLAQLFRRLHELKHVKDPKQDKFENTAPIAKMMVATILKSIAKHPDQIKMVDGTPPRFTSDRVVELRSDAPEILRRAIFFGFSKGGNDFRDGMRLLTRTLDDNRAIFLPSEGTKIEDIISSVSLTIQSLNELKLDPYYKKHGVTVNYFSNRHDQIALEPEIDFDHNDSAITYVGPTKYNGHYPGLVTENLSHPYILQHHQCVLAGTTGKPAIAFLRYQVVPDADRPGKNLHRLAIETAPGTSDALFPHDARNGRQDHTDRNTPCAIQGVDLALAQHGLAHIKVFRIPGEHGNIRYELRSTKYGNDIDKNEDDLLSRATMLKLHDAFEQMRLEDDLDVTVSSATTDPCLATLANDLLKAKRGYDGIEENGQLVDWKDKVVTTGQNVYNRRIDQINKFMGEVPLHLPLDASTIKKAPKMSEDGVARAA